MPGNQVIGKDVVLIGQEVVADDLEVSSQAISNWYAREAADIAAGKPAWGMPAPTLVQYRHGKTPSKVWKRSQLPAWRRWHAAHLAEQGAHIPRIFRAKEKRRGRR